MCPLDTGEVQERQSDKEKKECGEKESGIDTMIQLVRFTSLHTEKLVCAD